MKNKTDINRLHDVILKKLTSRGVGRTTVKIHELAGIIELGESEIVYCIISEFKDLHYLHAMIYDIFQEHNLKITKYYLRGFDCNNKHIRFTTNLDFRGIHTDIIKMRHCD